MFSDKDILKAIKSKDLVISPFDKINLNPSSYVFHLGSNFLLVGGGKKIDPLYDSPSSVYTPYKGELWLKPDDFVLAETLEEVTVGKKIGMLFDGVSTLGRLGVTVHITASLIQTGHGGIKPRKITLEIKNLSKNTIKLTPGMTIGKGIFFKLKTPASFLDDCKTVYSNDNGVGSPLAFNVRKNNKLMRI